MPDPFGWVARWYDRFAHTPDAGPLVRALELQAGQRLLDLGGGTGRVAQTLAGARPVVCDLSAAMTRQAQRKGLLVCQGRAETLPFAGRTFDCVLVVDAFHHFDNQHLAAQEMLRVLRPGGRLVLEEPDIRRPAIRLVSWAERLLGMPSHMLPLDELAACFAAVGGSVLAADRASALSVRLAVTVQEGRS